MSAPGERDPKVTRADLEPMIKVLAEQNPAWADLGEPGADGLFDIPDSLAGVTRTHQTYIDRLGHFLANILTFERALDVALSCRFASEDDRRLFVGSVLAHVPLGSKVTALEDVLDALGHVDSRGVARRAMECVERRNRLAHQPFHYDDDATGDDETVVHLTGRRGRVTDVTLGELNDWSTAVTDSTDEIMTATVIILISQGAVPEPDE